MGFGNGNEDNELSVRTDEIMTGNIDNRTMNAGSAQTSWMEESKQKRPSERIQEMVEKGGGVLQPFDDGHVPETFGNNKTDNNSHSTTTTTTTTTAWMATYPQHLPANSSVSVYDNVLPPMLVDALYETSHEYGQPWGTYVTIEQAQHYLQTNHEMRSITNNANDRKAPPKETVTLEEQEAHWHELAVAAVAHFLVDTIPNSSHCPIAHIVPDKSHVSSGENSTNCDGARIQALYGWEEFREVAHGVAVWALSSNQIAQQVQYHVDYAELLRYEHNVTVPPLWAGTIHCTSGEVKGGDFCVNLGGLDHYALHGYKGLKQPPGRHHDVPGKYPSPHQQDPDMDAHSVVVDHDTLSDWVTVPYCYNRGICHVGQLAHLSTPITSLPEGKSRVIMGFNVFGHGVGPEIRKAPEHSPAFRRRVHLHRSYSLQGMNLKTLRNHPRQNKGFTKLLVLAKRERVKQQLKERQLQLTLDIQALLQQEAPCQLSLLMEQLGVDTDQEWPKPVDVQVHISHLVRIATDQEINRIAVDPKHSPAFDKHSILMPHAILFLKEPNHEG